MLVVLRLRKLRTTLTRLIPLRRHESRSRSNCVPVRSPAFLDTVWGRCVAATPSSLSALLFFGIAIVLICDSAASSLDGKMWPYCGSRKPRPARNDLNARLSALRPTVHELMSIAGTAGLSLGVVHNDKLIHTAIFGFRDYGSKLPMDDETIFPGCS